MTQARKRPLTLTFPDAPGYMLSFFVHNKKKTKIIPCQGGDQCWQFAYPDGDLTLDPEREYSNIEYTREGEVGPNED